MRTLAIAAISAVALGGAAQAATISYTVSNSVTGQVPQVGSFNVAGFNTALGTLISATYEWEFDIESVGSITNLNTTTAANFTVQLLGTGILQQVSGAFTPNFLFNSDSDSESWTPLGANATENFSLSVTGFGSGTVDLGQAILGPISVSYNLTGLTGVSEGSNFNLVTTTVANAVARITYTYEREDTVVPVPAALPLLATALGLLGVARLRRKA